MLLVVVAGLAAHPSARDAHRSCRPPRALFPAVNVEARTVTAAPEVPVVHRLGRAMALRVLAERLGQPLGQVVLAR